MTDEELRDLCIRATKEGLKNGKVTADDMDKQLAAQDVEIRKRTAEALVIPPLNSRHASMKGTWTQSIKAKIMLDSTRLKNGEAQSRGYGFIEFGHHGHALACLRELNNNVEYCDFSASHANQVLKKFRFICFLT